MFVCVELSTSFLFSPSLTSTKSILLFSMADLKFSLNACLFLGLHLLETKSDEAYQIRQQISSNIHRPILYHIISFIQ